MKVTTKSSFGEKVEGWGDGSLIICDMWDYVQCPVLMDNMRSIALKINRLAGRLRRMGFLIIHAPSGTPTPKCDVADESPPVVMTRGVGSLAGEPSLKFSSDKDCSCDNHDEWHDFLDHIGRNASNPWKGQIETIDIHRNDAHTYDGREIWSLTKKSDNVLFCGVHANKCVLNKPFGLRKLVEAGKNVVLVRDLTDVACDYEPREEALQMTIDHIERYICPTVSYEELMSSSG